MFTPQPIQPPLPCGQMLSKAFLQPSFGHAKITQNEKTPSMACVSLTSGATRFSGDGRSGQLQVRLTEGDQALHSAEVRRVASAGRGPKS